MANALLAPVTSPRVARGYLRSAPPPDTAPGYKRAVIYLRVSTSEQAETSAEGDGYSIPAQREACFRKARELGAEVVDEYLDRGESARSTDRPALQLLLHRLQAMGDVDYVIVHKVDRLARNRRDDANLTLAIYQHGAKLVSCSEQIDDTPSGKLIHGIMATINEWYSANLGSEATKGMLQKAKQGGTPGRAPVGYRNVVERVSGREVRTVQVDPERAEHVVWAFSSFARRDVSLAELTLALEDRGLRSLPSKRRPGVPLSKSRVAAMLRNRYYLGVVTFKEAEYPGSHPPLIDPQVFDAVQAILNERVEAREKVRVHSHYLKGSLFCGRCQQRLCFSRSRGKGGDTYDYFFCTNRRTGACDQPHLQVDAIESAVADYYRQVRLPDDLVEAVRAFVRRHFAEEQAELERQGRKNRGKRKALEDAHHRLLQGYLEAAIELEDFRREQQRIGHEINAIDRATAVGRIRWQDVEATLEQVLYLASRCDIAYRLAGGPLRRRLNQALFSRIFVDATTEPTAQPSEPFEALLDRDGVRSLKATYKRQGSNEFCLAPPTGFEPVLPP